MSASCRILSGLLLAAFVIGLSGTTAEAGRRWGNTGTGFWDVDGTGGNWLGNSYEPDVSQPGNGDTTIIGFSTTSTDPDLTVSGGTAQVRYDNELARCILVGYSSNTSGTLDILSGSLLIGRNETGLGYLRVGASGTGVVNHSGGTVVVGYYVDNLKELELGIGGAANGTYNLSGTGVLETGDVEFGAGTGVLNLLGGTATLTGDVTGGSGTSTLLLDGTALDMSGGAIGTAANPIDNLTFASGTLSNVGSIQGTGGLTKTGAGTLTLGGTNTYTGDTTVDDGVLSISSMDNLGAGGVTLNGGALRTTGTGGLTVTKAIALTADSTLDTQNSGNTTYSGVISGAGGFTKIGGNHLRLNANNTYDGETYLNTATTYILQNNALGSTVGGTTVAAAATMSVETNYTSEETLYLNGGILRTSAQGATRYWSGDIVLGADSRVGAKNQTSAARLVLNGTISGPYGLNVGGNGETGIVRLGGDNSGYSGPITVSNGVLEYAVPENLGSGTVTLAGTTLRSIAGPTSNNMSVYNPIVLTGDSILDAQHPNNTAYRGLISDDGGSFGFTKTGANGILLYGTNTYSGETNLTRGTTYVYTNGVFGTTDGATTLASGATLSIETNYTTPETLYLNGGALRTSSQGSTRYWWGDVVLGANSNIRAKNQTSAATMVVNGTISGDYSLTVGSSSESGIVRFGGANTYTGDTRIVRGTLQLDNALALQGTTLDLRSSDTGVLTFGTPTAYTLGGLTGSRDLDMGGATLSIGNNDQDTTYSGALSNGALTKIGDGTLTLTGANSYAGATAVTAGTLLVNSTAGSGPVTVSGTGTLGGSGTIAGALTIESGATLAAGTSPGTLTLTDGLTFTGGTFSVELNGTTPGVDYDQIVVTGGDVQLGDAVASLAITAGYSPAEDDYLWIIDNTGSGITEGYFTSLPDGDSFDVSGRKFYIYYNADHATFALSGGNDVLLTSVPEPSTVAMLLGLAGVGLLGYLRRRRQA